MYSTCSSKGGVIGKIALGPRQWWTLLPYIIKRPIRSSGSSREVDKSKKGWGDLLYQE